MTYEGVVYYQDPLSSAEAASFNEDELELAGTTMESNLLMPGGGENLKIYSPKDGEPFQPYTPTPGQDFQNEDGSTITIEPEWTRWSPSTDAAPVTSGFMLPRPRSVEELLGGAQVVVVGTIASVMGEKWIGGYEEDGKAAPVDEGGIPVTDYELQVESTLIGDATLTKEGSLVLRMFGHLSDANAVITPNAFTLPNPGDRMLFALGRNPDGTYGSGPEGLLKVDGEKVEFIDGVPFAAEVSPEQFLLDIDGAIRPPCCKP